MGEISQKRFKLVVFEMLVGGSINRQASIGNNRIDLSVRH